MSVRCAHKETEKTWDRSSNSVYTVAARWSQKVAQGSQILFSDFNGIMAVKVPCIRGFVLNSVRRRQDGGLFIKKFKFVPDALFRNISVNKTKIVVLEKVAF